MPLVPQIEARDFYKNMPSLDHETGDIWHNLPGFGLPYNLMTTGIVISPACDLSQKKTETATVIPIIPIHEYLYSKSFYSEIWNELSDRLKPYGADDHAPSDRFSHPPLHLIEKSLQQLEGDRKQISLYNRLAAYKEYIQYTQALPGARGSKKPDIEVIFSGRRYGEILKKIFCNSFKSDIHFFPAYGAPSDFAPIPHHSVALFRYVYSIPLEILDAAQSSREEWWKNDCRGMSGTTPLIEHFEEYPLKVSRLKDDFLTDLISRYLGMFMRLGSRDFTKASLDKFATEMKGL
ncbi:hypothetical protein K3F43_19880 [Pseudomonas tussilaginis]|uniref:hypothetical protein n=1 Tax=unclassified Pseudomonas TaxID=196821 RepID=UPI000C6CD0DE|nr:MULTISPECIES: hypothetical protein [unclassified Pseudomonas]QYX46930.1 hypothetical protein K3F43_19880 [Pseudomonas sp. S11A 273]